MHKKAGAECKIVGDFMKYICSITPGQCTRQVAPICGIKLADYFTSSPYSYPTNHTKTK